MTSNLQAAPAQQNQHAMRYMDYLQLIETGHAVLQEGNSLDFQGERLLNMLGLAWHAGEMPTVLQVMGRADMFSPTTVHRRLKLLSMRGFINLVMDAEDNRVKHVVATQRAHDHFALMGSYLINARG